MNTRIVPAALALTGALASVLAGTGASGQVPPAPVTPPAIPSAPPASVDANIAARDPRTLNALLIPTDATLQANLEAGREFAKTPKDFVDLLNDTRRAFDTKPGGMFGEKLREKGIAVWLTPALEARWRGFLEGRQYASSARRQADFDALRQEVTSPRRTLTFLVEISDLVPKPKDKKSAPPPSDPASRVAGIRFVLSDDRDDNYDPTPGPPSPRLRPRQQFYDQIAGYPAEVAAGSLPETPSTGDAGRLVKRRPPYSDLGAFYLVTFDAFNPDGKARIGRDTQQVTLRVIGGPDGDKAAVFALNKLP